MGFLGGKERIRIPTVSIHSLKRHIIEYTGLRAESEKRALGSPILHNLKARTREQSLCVKQRQQ